MIEGLKPYAEYKESGVSWLGKIPAEWETKAFRLIAKVKKGRQPANLVGADERAADDLPYLSMDFIRSPKTTAAEFAKYQPNLVKGSDGDIVLLWDGSNAGEFMQAKYGIVSSTSALIKTQVVNNRFFFYACKLAEPTLRSFTVGMGIPHVDSNVLKNIRFSIPPPEEQNAIVRFLDHANRKIDRFIRTKRRLIELLNEQKQAIIQQAVTRSIDPNVQLKPSGIDWLGDVPEHWEVKRSKLVFREVDARSINGEETKLSMSQKLGLVRSSLIEGRRLMSESFVGAKICEPGDLVLNRLKAHLGVFALASEHGLVSPDYTVFRAIRPICGKYFELAYRTPACRVELRKRAKGIVQGFWRLYSDDFYQIAVPIPPLDEQNRIIIQLDTDLATLNHTISDAHREIDLFREYRTRLISDIVTGKLDVGGVELPAMDEAEALEDIDTGEDIEAEELIESEEVADADE